MKNLKHLFFIFFTLVLTLTPKSQDDDPPPNVDEIGIYNTSTTRTLSVKIFPVSMIMNGNNFYDLHTKYPDDEGNIRYLYLTTGHLYNGNFVSSGGFTSGITAEYCTNGVIITDNILNYVTTGMPLLQSSQYIVRNTITGSSRQYYTCIF